jgi:hypothetical protein
MLGHLVNNLAFAAHLANLAAAAAAAAAAISMPAFATLRKQHLAQQWPPAQSATGHTFPPNFVLASVGLQRSRKLQDSKAQKLHGVCISTGLPCLQHLQHMLAGTRQGRWRTKVHPVLLLQLLFQGRVQVLQLVLPNLLQILNTSNACWQHCTCS